MQRFTATYPAVPASVAAIRRQVTSLGQECGLSGYELNDLRLAVSEAATNAIVHGPQGDTAEIRLDVDVSDDELLVVISDGGTGVAPRPASPGLGLGLPVMASTSNRLELRQGKTGTEVHMAFPCPSLQAS